MTTTTDAERVLRRALKRYGKHTMDCSKWGPSATAGSRCRCGLDAALRAPQQPPNGDLRNAAISAEILSLPLFEQLPEPEHVQFLRDCQRILSRHMPSQPCVDVEALAAALWDLWNDAHAMLEEHPVCADDFVERIRSHVTDAATVRAEALEEAAKVAGEHDCMEPEDEDDVTCCGMNCGLLIAGMIRALAPKERSE